MSAARRARGRPTLVVAVASLAVVGAVAIGCTDPDGGAGRSPTTDRAEPAVTDATGAGAGDGSVTEGGSGSIPTTDPDHLDGRTVTITSITDGDTFRAGEERVRLIGIDAPEVDRDDCGADRATAALAGLIPVGSEVVLVADVDPTDRYDRTLAYVHRASDGLHVNLALAREGFVTPLVVEPNHAHATAIDAAVRGAVAAGRGLWDGTCPVPDGLGGAPSPPSTSVAPPPTAADPSDPTREGCDPAYPTVCIPPSPPDLDCADVPHRSFPVLPPDPHRFDGGGDGIGCER